MKGDADEGGSFIEVNAEMRFKTSVTLPSPYRRYNSHYFLRDLVSDM